MLRPERADRFMSDLRIPPARQKVASSWTDPVLVLDDIDTGKSTAVRVFYETLRPAHTHGRHWEIQNRARSVHHAPHGGPAPEASSVTRRPTPRPRQYRAEQLASYVEEVPRRTLYGLVVAVRPNLDFPADQLVVLASNDGFVEALGRSNAIDGAACTVTVEAPPPRPPSCTLATCTSIRTRTKTALRCTVSSPG